MHIKWSKRIMGIGRGECEYCGLFYRMRENVHFLFKNSGDVCDLSQVSDRYTSIYVPTSVINESLPCEWILVESDEDPVLFLDENCGINLLNFHVIDKFSDKTTQSFLELKKPEKYHVEAAFTFDEYRIAHKGNCGYTCTKNGRKLWDFNGRAYLYTDIVRWNNRIFFGTAGHGGYFYVLDIESGEAIASIKTGGTSSVEQNNNICYVLSNSKGACLLCVDLYDGSIKRNIPLPGKATQNSRLKIIDNEIHTITFDHKRDILQSAIWSCVEL